MTDSRIALFPLNIVLYPGATLPLHIFEPRYKLMINHCIAHNREFGVILAGEKGVATVGCTAAITQKLKDYEDGRMDILTQGRTVFRALNLLHEKDYHEALVEFLPDDAAPPRQPARNQEEAELLSLFQECHTLVYGQLWVTSGVESAWPLSFQMGARLPLELEEKQALLEMRAEPDRRTFLIECLKDMLPRLGNLYHARRSASGNGHHLN
ncbi:MAG: LON peptidase substrate-binding domain-containing protein [Candidatus Acidiferrales bacterium]